MKKNTNKNPKSNKIPIIPFGTNHLFCKTPGGFRILKVHLRYFSNHLQGQDILHIDVYDEDSIKDEKIGSVKIDLKDLYQKGEIDQWFKITAKLGLVNHGEIHLVLFYQKLQI